MTSEPALAPALACTQRHSKPWVLGNRVANFLRYTQSIYAALH